MSPRVRDFVIEHGTASLKSERELDPDEVRASNESQELLQIMNEYNELIAYLDSPNGNIKPGQSESKRNLFKGEHKMVKRSSSTTVLAAPVDHSIPAKAQQPSNPPFDSKQANVIKSNIGKQKAKDKSKKKKGKKPKKLVIRTSKSNPPASVLLPSAQEVLRDVSIIKNDIDMKKIAKKKLAEIEEKNKVLISMQYIFLLSD